MTIVAVRGGRVFTGLGATFDGGTVLLDGPRILAVGDRIEPPAGATIVDAGGCWVTPGLIDAHSHVGVHEEANGWAGADGSELSGPNMAGIRALDAITIDDIGFEDAVTGGVTATVVKPGSGNPIGGVSAALKTWGGSTVDQQVISPAVGVKSALGENPKQVYGERKQLPSTRMGVAFVIRQALLDARHYAGSTEPEKRIDLTLEALGAALRGELLWDQHAHRHDDIATAIRLADEFGLRLVINHGTEADRVAPLLAERDIPVIFGPMLTTRSKVEVRNAGPATVVALDRAGVRVALTTDHPVFPIGQLRLQAATAVRSGLPWSTALAAVTSQAARIIGLDGRIGAIAAGLDADLVLWSGDPFEISSRAELVYIDGRVVAEWTGGGHRLASRWPTAGTETR
ncbi:amidohydrolase [Leifsonia poae]|uniref:amidohydrolase n=1 Tax=Leifsonia poae TaxID=110933 RepID=UPI001CBAEF94|nr:amidohydrolase [Leifsonia poae]